MSERGRGPRESNGGGGNRTPVPNDVKPCEIRAGETPNDPCCTARCTESPKTATQDAELAAVIGAWPVLPAAIKRAILAMIGATRQSEGTSK